MELESNNSLNFKKKYLSVMKELKQFNLYNKEGLIIKFQKEALIG
jgi:hypothetical protein